MSDYITGDYKPSEWNARLERKDPIPADILRIQWNERTKSWKVSHYQRDTGELVLHDAETGETSSREIRVTHWPQALITMEGPSGAPNWNADVTVWRRIIDVTPRVECRIGDATTSFMILKTDLVGTVAGDWAGGRVDYYADDNPNWKKLITEYRYIDGSGAVSVDAAGAPDAGGEYWLFTVTVAFSSAVGPRDEIRLVDGVWLMLGAVTTINQGTNLATSSIDLTGSDEIYTTIGNRSGALRPITVKINGGV